MSLTPDGRGLTEFQVSMASRRVDAHCHGAWVSHSLASNVKVSDGLLLPKFIIVNFSSRMNFEIFWPTMKTIRVESDMTRITAQARTWTTDLNFKFNVACRSSGRRASAKSKRSGEACRCDETAANPAAGQCGGIRTFRCFLIRMSTSLRVVSDWSACRSSQRKVGIERNAQTACCVNDYVLYLF